MLRPAERWKQAGVFDQLHRILRPCLPARLSRPQ